MTGAAFIAVVLLNLFALTMIYAALRRRVDRATDVSRAVNSIREQVGDIVAELNQTTDRNLSLLEDRVAHLSKLMQAADSRLGALRRHDEATSAATEVYTHLRDAAGRETAGHDTTSLDGDDARPAAAAVDPAFGLPAHHAAAPQSPENRPVDGEVNRSDTMVASENEDQRRQEILALHGAGVDVAQIAARVRVPLGEVELIISLARRGAVA